MLQFLTLHNGKYVLYDNETHSFDFYRVVHLKRLLATKVIQGICLHNDCIEVQYEGTQKNLTRDLGDIKFIDGLEYPTYIIRTHMKLPKLPAQCTLFYKGIYVFISNSKVYVPQRQGNTNKRGKIISISPIQDCPAIHNYAKKELLEYQVNYTTTQYSEIVQEFFSCLSYDSGVVNYNVYIYTNDQYLDLTKFPKSVKIKRYNIFINYRLYIINENIQRIKYSGMYLRLDNRFIDITNHISRPITLLDCTDFKIADWHQTGLRAGFEEIVCTKLHNYGVIVFKRSSTLIQNVKQFFNQREDFNVINIGNFKNTDGLEQTLQAIRKQQGKYALTHTNERTLVVLLANIT